MGLTFKTLMHGINVHRLMNKLNIQTLMSSIVTSVPSVTNVYYFFMDCLDAYRFVRCGFVYVNVCYGAAFMYAAAQLCGRAYVGRSHVLPRSRNAAAHSYVAAHLYAAAHPWCRACGQMVSSSTCCRVPCRRAVLCVAASHGAAQFSVLPRPMLPCSSTCCRVPWCRAVLCVAASHVVAQFYMLPRSMVPRSPLSCRVSWCRE